MKCPCEGCIGIALCRHKTYNKLFIDCILICDYIPLEYFQEDVQGKHIHMVQKILTPTRWSYEQDCFIYNKTCDNGKAVLSSNFSDWETQRRARR